MKDKFVVIANSHTTNKQIRLLLLGEFQFKSDIFIDKVTTRNIKFGVRYLSNKYI